MMSQWVQEILERFGQEATLVLPDGTERSIRAFLQPVTQHREAEPFQMTELGSVDDRLWLYIGDQELPDGAHLRWKEQSMYVRSSRPYDVGTERLFWWAMLAKEKVA